MQRQKFFWNALVDYWFRMEMDGWENVTESPVLLVGIHSGAPFVWDAWTVGVQWWRRFGPDRPLHGTAHDALMAIPVIGTYFRAMGVLPAAPDSIATALAEGRDVALWPGGEVDSLRPWSERDMANLADRKGFVKMAIKAGVPIVPVATVGGADAMPVLIRDGRAGTQTRVTAVRLNLCPFSPPVRQPTPRFRCVVGPHRPAIPPRRCRQGDAGRTRRRALRPNRSGRRRWTRSGRPA